MKTFRLLLGLVLAFGLLGVVGCKKKNDAAAPLQPMVVEGVSVDLPKLIQSLESATPDQQASARNIQMAFRYRQMEKAAMEAEKLATDTTLTEEQKKIAADVLEQVKQVIAKMPPPAQ